MKLYIISLFDSQLALNIDYCMKIICFVVWNRRYFAAMQGDVGLSVGICFRD